MLKKILRGNISLHSKLKLKARHSGEGKPFIEVTHGDDLHRKSGIWMKVLRVIDRRGNRYEEKVTNPQTREVIHSCEEPLSEHQGHGSATSKKQK